MSDEIVAALDRLTAAVVDAQAEARDWRTKMTDLVDAIRAAVQLSAMDVAVSSQTLTDCEMHLKTLADHFSPPSYD